MYKKEEPDGRTRALAERMVGTRGRGGKERTAFSKLEKCMCTRARGLVIVLSVASLYFFCDRERIYDVRGESDRHFYIFE